MKNVLIVDDDPNILKVLEMRLESEGYNVKTAMDAAGAERLVGNAEFDLAVVDLKLAGGNGIDLMKSLRAVDPDLPVIILTAHGSVSSAVEAMQQGAYTYLTKPFDNRELLVQIKNGIGMASLSKEVKRLRIMVKHDFESDNIIGQSTEIKKVLELVTLAARTESNVYIHGESGAGKGMIARAIHRNSDRKDKPFVAINCAAIPETLLESELFGFEKGAFTGAVAAKKGLFVQAQGGVVFLDEIAELPMTMQGKLLKALDEKEFYPLGAQKPVKVDVRIISASNRIIEDEVEQRAFRSDLFYRIHVIPLKIPPLRERREDIPLLVNYFLHKYAAKMNKEAKTLTPSAIRKLMLYHWPGNIRELENIVECAVAMCTKDAITEEFIILPEAKAKEGAFMTFKDAKQEFEKAYLMQLLELSRGNISEAAKLAGKYRADIYELLEKHNISIPDFRPE